MICVSGVDLEWVTKHVAREYYGNYNLFVCFVQSSVTKDWRLEMFGSRPLSVIDLLAKFDETASFQFRHQEQNMAEIFIIQGHQTTTALEADESYNWKSFEESFSMKFATSGRNLLCLFVPYRKGYISTLGSVIKLPGSKPRDILDIFSEAKKLFYEKSYFTIPDPVHNLKGPVYLN